MRTKRTKITSQETEQIVALYLEGHNISSIKNKLNLCKNSVVNHLKKQMVYNPIEVPSYTFNKSFFKTIDNEQKAYWLGFIAADGNVGSDKKGKARYLAIGIKESDRHHLELFKSVINATHPIKTVTCTNKGKKHKLSKITICSIGLADDLMFHGVKPRKSYDYKFPSTIPNNLLRHYIRGHFDGDGSWHLQKGKYPCFSMVGHSDFIKSLQLHLIEACDLSKNKIIETNKPYTMRVLYTGGKQCKKIFDYMYNRSKIYLKRKKNKVENYWSK